MQPRPESTNGQTIIYYATIYYNILQQTRICYNIVAYTIVYYIICITCASSQASGEIASDSFSLVFT